MISHRMTGLTSNLPPTGVGGFVDLAHPPSAEGGLYLVGTERGTCGKRHRGCLRREARQQLQTPLAVFKGHDV